MDDVSLVCTKDGRKGKDGTNVGKKDVKTIVLALLLSYDGVAYKKINQDLLKLYCYLGSGYTLTLVEESGARAFSQLDLYDGKFLAQVLSLEIFYLNTSDDF